MKQCLILCGGQSPEHEISLLSAKNVVAALDRSLYEPIIVGIDPQGRWREQNSVPEKQIITGPFVHLAPVKELISDQGRRIIDVAFPVLHGPKGEDGSIQGLLDSLNIPYVGPDVVSSALCSDKDRTKAMLQQAGLNTAPWICAHASEYPSFGVVKKRFGLPVFIKPANMGSSLGVHQVKKEADYLPALKDAWLYDHKILIEKAIKGRELECALFGLAPRQVISEPGEIITAEEYSFDEKYSEQSAAILDTPAKNLSDSLREKVKATALAAGQALNCEILSRVDVFLTTDGQIFINEINTLPGFTNISMYPKLMRHMGYSDTSLISSLLELADERFARERLLKKH